jgi:2-C-methyl-D-erythritol 4-phosphate cytidylyltransferase/2-C-methyl-D-erythritol 2,4-cyclodiphosphate synthase
VSVRPRTLVVIPAAGSGIRFGGELPKQYLPFRGRTILDRVIDRFLGSDLVDEVVVAVSPERMQAARERVRFVAGGATRQQSVANALAASDGFELVAVHDAVRPFFPIDALPALLDAAREHGASLPALAVTDTIHVIRDGAIASTPDREHLVAAQTPQCFRVELLRDVLARAERNAETSSTDEAGLAARYGFTVKVLPGDPRNFKITRPDDLERAARMEKS